MEAVLEAREQGLIRHIGITGHRSFVQIEALNRFDFDTVLTPVNRVLAAHISDFTDFSLLLEVARQKDVGVIAMKAIAKRPWKAMVRMYKTWYEPFDEPVEINRSLQYTLSQDVVTAALPGDLSLWPIVIEAAERFTHMSVNEQGEVVRQVEGYKPIFPLERDG
jgi:predicted aldo/keto reductase-like oxidoreductase